MAHSEASLGWGGQEIRVFEEMKAMRDRGHRMLLVAQPHSVIFTKAMEAGFQVRAMTADRLKYPVSILKLSRFFKTESVDVVNTHSSRDGYIAGIAARLAGVPLVIRTRHIDVDYPNKIISRFGFSTIPHHVTTTSQLIVQRLIEQLSLNPDQVSCISTGIDLDHYANHQKAADTLRQDWLSGSANQLVGMVTVLRSWKGHRIFLEAISQIKEDLPRTRYIIAGDGPMRELIESWIEELDLQECVELVGHRDDVAAVLAALDIMVLPSYAHEGIPQIVLQAQVSGTPVIGTTAGGIPEVIQNDETGLLVNRKDPEALGQAILKLSQDSELKKHLSEKALHFAQAHHGLQRMCVSTEGIYDKYL
ncbi:MAG: glycosyltransferase [Verrucomicrobiota bacterium]